MRLTILHTEKSRQKPALKRSARKPSHVLGSSETDSLMIWSSDRGPFWWWLIYSEQKNQFTKGQNLLVSQITAQGTKVKAYEFYGTKIDILSFVIPKYRTLVPAIDLI